MQKSAPAWWVKGKDCCVTLLYTFILVVIISCGSMFVGYFSVVRLLNAFAEEQATEDAVYYMGEALRKGVVELDVFLKVTECHVVKLNHCYSSVIHWHMHTHRFNHRFPCKPRSVGWPLDSQSPFSHVPEHPHGTRWMICDISASLIRCWLFWQQTNRHRDKSTPTFWCCKVTAFGCGY